MPTQEWLSKNKDHVKEYKKRWREKNREKSIGYVRKHRLNLTDEAKQKIRIYSAKWLRENREKKLIYLREYNRGRKSLLKHRENCCKVCGFNIIEVLDSHHIIPRSKGGSDDKSNRITLCANCHRMVHAGLVELFSE